MPEKPTVIRLVEDRLTGDYIANQYTSFRQAEFYQDHKTRLSELDTLYRGELNALDGGDDLPDHPLVENKFKNAIHDLARLATEAKPVPVFPLHGEGVPDYKQKLVREQIADTIWEVGRGPVLQRQLYLDIMGAGFAALSVYWNKKSEYAQFMRLDPRYCYPTVRSGILQTMLYVETMDIDLARRQWPDLPLGADTQATDKDITVATWYDDKEVATAVLETRGDGEKVVQNYLVSSWQHELDCIPVAFKMLDTFDGAFRGLFDQLQGPQIIRNKIINYLDAYMQDMIYASFQERGIVNSDERPGPFTIYHHDVNVEGETFMRRVEPAAPAGQVFALIREMQETEATEALQPPARIGQVSQSIASGNFVNSTQGSLSSAVKELQDHGGDLRYQLDYVAFKIEEKYLNKQKPLIRPVSGKVTYTPKKDIDGKYFHRILYGAAAGLDRQYADVRVLQHNGAGFISKETARNQIDYVDDPSAEQNKIDREELATVLKQRFAADPSSPMSLLVQAYLEMSKGQSLVDAMDKVAPAMVQLEQEAKQAQLAEQGMTPTAQPEEPGAEQLALEKGEVPEEEGPAIEPIPLPSPVLQQQFVTSGR